jgi:micrococcal nuclease
MILKRLLIIILFFISPYSFADFNADIVRIIDGDTIDVVDGNNKKLRIRLLGIDAPESEQPFGHESSTHLKKILNGKSITIISKPDRNKPYTLGHYKRVIGKIILNGRDINLEMIEKGMAWHFKKYKNNQPIKDRYSYNKSENEARKINIGLWSSKNPLPPWQWRKFNKKK